MERDLPGYSPRLADNPLKWQEFVRLFDPAMVATGVLSPLVLTAAAQVISRVVAGPNPDGWFGVALPWVLVVGIVVTALLSQRQVWRARTGHVPFVCWVHATLQMLWLAGLAWTSIPELSVVLALVLCALAFHDARYFYDALSLRLHYLLVWPACFLLLWVVDLLGGPGLLAREQANPGFLRAAIPLVILVALLIQVVLVVVGRQWYRLDARQWAHGRVQAQLAEMRREREVISRSCDLLTQGLTAGRFSHDVASPVSTACLSAAELSDGLARLEAELQHLGHGALAEQVADLRGVSATLMRGQARIHEMTEALARSLRDGTTLSFTDASELLADAVEQMSVACARHRISPPAPEVQLEPGQVVVSDEHSAALGTILVNGALHCPAIPLQVSGAQCSPWFYVITVRDFGVAPDGRLAALARVRRALALVEPGATASGSGQRSYEGFGIGLTLAKLLLVRHNGWLAAGEPDAGNGLVFTIVLPSVEPSRIPVQDNQPETVAAHAARLSGAHSTVPGGTSDAQADVVASAKRTAFSERP